MYSEVQEPSQRLAKEIISVLRWRSTISFSIECMILAILFGVSIYFSWYTWINWVIAGSAMLASLIAIWSIGIRPRYIFKNTRYDVDEEFLQVKIGAFFEQHELVPMTKIQAVSTNQGPILRKFNLYSIEIETMGSSHEIVALRKETAIDLRNEIAHFAKIREEDE